MRHSRIWPAFSTARRWRCNPRHTREIPGPGSPRRGRRRPSAELGCREGKPVWNLSRKSSDLEKPEQGTGGSTRRDPKPRPAPRRSGRAASIHTQPVNRFGARGPSPAQGVATFSPSAQNNWGATRSGRPPRILAGSITGQFGPRPRSSSAGRTGCLLRVSGTVFSFTICRRSCRRVSVLPGPVGGHLIGREPSGQAPRPGGMAQRKSRHGQFPPPEPAPLFAYPSLTSRPRAPRHRALALARIWSNRRRLSRRIQKRACRHRRRPTRRRPVRP
jgi:hypothetical protein